MDSNANANANSPTNTLDPIVIAARGNEITGLDIFQKTEDDFELPRVGELMSQMHADQPTGGIDMVYGKTDTQHLRFWKANPSKSSESSKAPIIVFVHGGSWRSGTNLDSIGSTKVGHLTELGYAFASINYTLFPTVTVEEQVQEIANSINYLVKNASDLSIDPERVVLMGHSSGAHVVTLLGTDTRYLERAGTSVSIVQAVIALDGSNYNAAAELNDNPGQIADHMLDAFGTDLARLHDMSPTYHARAPNAHAFLLLHTHRHGDIRQGVEFVAALKAAGTEAVLHVFEGQGFEGHMQVLLRLGDRKYPATVVMDSWLEGNVPVN
ncbi:Alpha/Beta hydrolase protein [Penicillium cataractarum]|uniref:Alpha/Beta hydrolase protein n=1 Tax=Penicillium cataractarum TaxID=2100454 RepID=A0A9W9V4N5_9EURO|nr:Alpha/Beta hydrolase protein [Penicillium cataractarum]KAJ5368577.1 Alpha/Beta hydrolase protein [Penicillium cataractarum]